MMNNQDYWKGRLENSIKLSEKQILKPLKKMYRKTFLAIRAELLNIWLDMNSSGEVSQTTLYQAGRMANLQALLSKELHKLGEKNIEFLQMGLYNVFLQGYEDMDTFLGLSATFSFLDEQVAREIIAENYKNANFSERVWKDLDKL